MASPSAPAAELHDEDVDLVERLAKLQQMHQQIFELRTLLPDQLLGPARESVKDPRRMPPAKLAGAMSATARKGANDIRQFKKDWHDEKTRDVFQKAGVAEVPQGSDAWMVNYPALLSSRKTDSEIVNITNAASSEDLTKALDQFKASNNTVKVTTASETDPLPLTIEVSGLRFIISKDNTSTPFTVTPERKEGNNKLVQKVADQINLSQTTSDFSKLLAMISAYHNLKTRPCDKCKEIYDGDLELPVIRKPNSSPLSVENEVSWTALHSSCT